MLVDLSKSSMRKKMLAPLNKDNKYKGLQHSRHMSASDPWGKGSVNFSLLPAEFFLLPLQSLFSSQADR
jgi:hypothetical protein